MPLPDKNFTDHFKSLHQDAVLWKSLQLWKDAADPDRQAAAMERLVEMLLSIQNEPKRVAYFREISEAVKLRTEKVSEEISALKKQIAAKRKSIEKLISKTKLTDDENNSVSVARNEILLLEQQLSSLKGEMMAKLPETELKKYVVEEQKRRKQEIENKKMQATFEKNVKSAADAGLPDDFEGTRDDVYAALKYGIYIHDKVFYSRGGTKGDYPISNFTMKIIYHVDSNDDQAFRLISIKNVYGFECMININTDDFVSVGSFKKILARRGDFVFFGTDSDLARLQLFLQKDETSAKRIETLGWNNRNRFWTWSNGLTVIGEKVSEFIPIDKYGIVEWSGKKYFIPACSMMYADKEGMFVNEKKFIYIEPIEGFGFVEWSRCMYGAYEKKAIPAILFYIGSLFRDIMMSKIRRYPLLNLFGPPGAGKGEMYDSLVHMFGHKQDQIMLGGATTVVGFMRKLAQFKNALVGLDEYKNNLQPKVIESLKNLYDGIGYERGKMSNDFATESTPVNSSTILAGQDMPTIEPALFMRCIMLSFEEGKFSENQRKNFQKLKNDYEYHGLSYISAELLQFRGVFEDRFKDQYLLIFKQSIKDVASVEIDDRMIMNISILLTIMHLTKDELEFPFTYNEAKAYLIDNMKTQHAILAGNNDVAKFWGVVESLYHQNMIRDGHDFIIQDGYLYIRLIQVQPLYQKELIQRRDANFLSRSTLEYYLKLDNGVYAGYERKRFPDGSNTWCFKMKYDKLGIDLFKAPTIDSGENEVFFKRRFDRAYEMAGIDNPDNEEKNVPAIVKEKKEDDLVDPYTMNF